MLDCLDGDAVVAVHGALAAGDVTTPALADAAAALGRAAQSAGLPFDTLLAVVIAATAPRAGRPERRSADAECSWVVVHPRPDPS